jgi:hypothetical protein
MNRARVFHVFDAHREYLGSFQTFHAAHDWAHLQAALGGVATPIEVDDRARRVTRQITRESCETLACGSLVPAKAAADGADDYPPHCPAAGGIDAATSLHAATNRSPDAFQSGGPGRAGHQIRPGDMTRSGQAPMPRTPLDAEITGGRRRS